MEECVFLKEIVMFQDPYDEELDKWMAVDIVIAILLVLTCLGLVFWGF